MKTNETRELMTAYHEAGHAVAQYRLFPEGRWVDGVSIERKDDGTLGRHTSKELFPHPDDDPAMVREQYENEVLCLCAGYAGTVAMGYGDEEARGGCWGDFDAAEETVQGWATAPLEEQLKRAVQFMRRPENKNAVERVGTELLEHGTLDCDELEIVIEVLDGKSTEEDLAQYRALRDAART